MEESVALLRVYFGLLQLWEYGQAKNLAKKLPNSRLALAFQQLGTCESEYFSLSAMLSRSAFASVSRRLTSTVSEIEACLSMPSITAPAPTSLLNQVQAFVFGVVTCQRPSTTTASVQATGERQGLHASAASSASDVVSAGAFGSDGSGSNGEVELRTENAVFATLLRDSANFWHSPPKLYPHTHDILPSRIISY